MIRSIVLLAAALFARAQTAPPSAAQTSQTVSISGTVRDAGNGAAMPNVSVSIRNKSALTDSDGRYTLRDVDPGPQRIAATGSVDLGRPTTTRQVMVNPAQDLTGIDITLRTFGEISGKVVDQNNEPVPGISVALVTRHYLLGALRFSFANLANTDDQGEFVIRRVEPDRAYLLAVNKRELELNPISESPQNPKLRRPAWIPTFYPGTPSMEGAQAITLKPGERREGIWIQAERSASYCADAFVQPAPGAGELHFQISETQPTYGVNDGGGVYGGVPGGKVSADGKLRICNLHPGQYQLAVSSNPDPDHPLNGPVFYGTQSVIITDRDLAGVSIAALPRIPVAGEVLWDGGNAPDTAPTAPLSVSGRSLTRTEYPSARPAIPGPFKLPDLALDEYIVEVQNGVPKGAYVKEITYGDKNLKLEPLRPGTANGQAALRVILARDGGTVTANVTDKNGNPLTDLSVVVMPDPTTSPAVLAAVMTAGKTDQNGAWTSGSLPPGKYNVVAPDLVIDKSPECIGKLLDARDKASRVEIRPGGAAQVALAVIRLN